MAGNDESQEKTEEATPRKLRDARKKGQVAKSRDLTAVLLLFIAFVTLSFISGRTGTLLKDHMVGCFEQIAKAGSSSGMESLLLPLLQKSIEVMTYILLPLVIIVFVCTLLICYMQVGSAFSVEPIKFTLKKLNPIEGFKNLFKLRSLVELIKSTLKITLVFLIAYFVVKTRLQELIYAVTAGLLPILKLAGEILSSFIIKICIFFTVIALFDFLYQRWQYSKDLRMSKYEVMQEYKRDEGDPMLKSHRRQMHQELSNTDMAKVAKSDVVVVNPIHLAIAILYDRETMDAPQLMVKGQRLVAEQIKNLAREANIPIIENVPLAHALFELEIGDDIPEDLYEAMAEVLCFVYRLRDRQPGNIEVASLKSI